MYVVGGHGEVMPQCQIKIEVLQYEMGEGDVVVARTILKSGYIVYDNTDPVLRSISHTLFLITREMGDRSDFTPNPS